MKILNILEKLGDKTFNFSEEKSESRRESIFKIGTQGKDLLKVALPTGIIAGAFTANAGNSARTAATAGIADVLNFALKLEYLESQYYTMGITKASYLAGASAAEKAVFSQIQKHEVQHVQFLKAAIQSLGGTPDPEPTFDFTANNTYNPFGSYADFLALSQAFEDTGVRAYKGQAGNLMGDDNILQAALQIHSVEARHASQVRRIRMNKGWIEGNSSGSLPAAIYAGEDNTTQGGVDAVSITTVGAAAVREAFDEPLTQAEVVAIITPFL